MIRQNYVIALYLRISDEDEDMVNESNSIVGQRLLLENFVSENKELAKSKVLTFADDGYSGTNFNRPGICKLLEHARGKKIDCIIVKDFSRFGRNYIEVGNLIEQVFPFLGVRFISVNDNFDSSLGGGAAGSIDVAFKNLIHDLYSKDISQKVRSVRKTKSESGKFVTAFAPYGYAKSKNNKNTLIIDEECDAIVRRIYKMALDGARKAVIARQLNAEGIPSPIMVRKLRNDNFKSWCANEKCHWTTATISHILEDRRYTGDLVYGKLRPSAVGSRKDVRVPQEEWVIVPNAHPAIITKEVFQAVNDMKITHKYKRKVGSPLSGKIKCIVCNHAFVRKSKSDNSYYFCRTHWQTDKYECFTGKLNEKDTEKVILSALNMFLSLYEKAENVQEHKAVDKENLLKTLSSLERKIVLYKNERLTNYESYKANKISKDTFIIKQKELEGSIKSIDEEVKVLETQLTQLTDSPFKDTLKNLKGYAPFEVLTKELADKFVKAVFVNKNGNIQITWTFSVPFEHKTV